MQYNAGRNSGTIYVEQPSPKHVTLILNSADPQKAQTTFSLARDLYEKGIETTILLEGAGVTLVRTNYSNMTGYEGGIAVCPRCMTKFGITKSELPDGAYIAHEELTFSIHAGDNIRPSFE